MKSARGFTLVELLVVISIIAILSVVGITIFTGVQKGARDTRRRADIDAIAKALEVYHLKNGRYPFNQGWCDYTKNSDLKTILDPYFASGSIPQDPTRPENTEGNYVFQKTASGYELYASLESEPQGTVTGFCTWIPTNPYNLKRTNQQ